MKVEEFGNGAVREDKTGKGRFDLIPWCAIMRIAKHMEESLKVYSPRNWENGLPMHSMMDSAFRHLAKYMDGWDDEDHLCAAATNLLMAMWTEEKLPKQQDIPSRTLSLGSSLRSTSEVVENTYKTTEAKEDPKENFGDICRYYNSELDRCLGTKECDPCKFSGYWRSCPNGKPR